MATDQAIIDPALIQESRKQAAVLLGAYDTGAYARLATVAVMLTPDAGPAPLSGWEIFGGEEAAIGRVTGGTADFSSTAAWKESFEAARFVAQVVRPQEKVIFKELADQWRNETRFLSAVDDIAMHPAYQRIIGMGQKAVPLILRELQDRLDHWFWALESITGESPVPPEDAGRMQRMRDEWLEWGHSKGLI